MSAEAIDPTSPGKTDADAQIDGIAEPLDEGVRAHSHARRGGRRDDLDGAMHKTRCADALEVKIAGEVIAAGPQRRQRRIELRLHLDEGAGRRRRAAAHGKPDTLRLVDDPFSLDPLDTEHEAVGFLALLAQLDETGQRHAISGIAQERMSDQRRLERGNGKAGAHRKQTERNDEGHGPPAQKHNRKRGGDGQSRRRPPCRLCIGCKSKRRSRRRTPPQTTAAAGRRRLRPQPIRGYAPARRIRSGAKFRPNPCPKRGALARPAKFWCRRALASAGCPRPPPRVSHPSRAKTSGHAIGARRGERVSALSPWGEARARRSRASG